MVWPEPRAPSGEDAGDLAPHALPALKFHAMPLAIVEANGLDALIAVERVSQADGQILPAREQHQCSGPVAHLQPPINGGTHIVLSLPSCLG